MELRKISYSIRDGLIPFAIKVNPNYVSYSSVILSLAILFVHEPLYQAAIIFGVLFLDSYDGLVARKFKLENRQGLTTDLACDRYSELIIFISHPIILPLVGLNIAFSIMNLKKGWYILPLRHVWMVYLILTGARII